MRVLVVLVVLAAAATLTLDADASRKPTPAEKAAVTYAILTQVPEIPSSPATVVINRVVVSTVRPGPRANFTRFAGAFVVARDASIFPAGPRTAIVGLHRNGYWIMVGYGPNRVICKEAQFFFGGRRAAILRDLGIKCV